MNTRLAHLLVRLYPRCWRERYGAEFEAVLQTGRGGLRTSLNVVRSALSERVFPTTQGELHTYPHSFGAMTKRPGAFLPVAMSSAALALMFIGPRIFGDLHATDEGPTAHLWQLLMAGQMPLVAFFAVKWLRRAPKQALEVLAVQAGAVLVNLAAVFILGVG